MNMLIYGMLACSRKNFTLSHEDENLNNLYAVSVKKGSVIIDHMPEGAAPSNSKSRIITRFNSKVHLKSAKSIPSIYLRHLKAITVTAIMFDQFTYLQST